MKKNQNDPATLDLSPNTVVDFCEEEPPFEIDHREIERRMEYISDFFGIHHLDISEISYRCGPSFTRYEILPAFGTGSERFLAFEPILSSIWNTSIRMTVAQLNPRAVYLELPHCSQSPLPVQELLQAKDFFESKSKLTVCIGEDIKGAPCYLDLARAHLLLAAGSGSPMVTEMLHCVLLSLLAKAKPNEVRLLLCESTKIEFEAFLEVPHLLTPILHKPEEMMAALAAIEEEINARLERFKQFAVSGIQDYNGYAAEHPEIAPLPRIVVLIRELADLMYPFENVSEIIRPLLIKSRCTGIHFVIGTTCPYEDVLTEPIVQHLQSRIVFHLDSKKQSLLALDETGAEKLCFGRDMLFCTHERYPLERLLAPQAEVDDLQATVRKYVQNPDREFVRDEAFAARIAALSKRFALPPPIDFDEQGDFDTPEKEEQKYQQAVQIVRDHQICSAALLQKELCLTYAQAARLLDRMEEEGILTKRTVTVSE